MFITTIYFLLFGMCKCFLFSANIKNIFNLNKSPPISIKIYNEKNTRDISRFITKERYKDLPDNLFNEMVGMMDRDFSTRRKNCYLNLPFTILLAFQDSSIVGVITIESSEININGKKESPIISNLIVSSKMRRKGIAKKLTIRAEKIAKLFNYKEVYLLVNTDNKPAIKLYKSRKYKSLRNTKNTTKIVFKNNRFRNQECVNIIMKKKI